MALFGASGPGYSANSRPNDAHFHAMPASVTTYSAAIAFSAGRDRNHDMDAIGGLKPFNFAQAVARAGLGVDGQPLSAKKTAGVEAGGFAGAMTQALKSVSAQQMEAQGLQRELQLDNPTVSLEQTMVAMQKAQIGFQATLAVRNQFVRAYTDIMNMQV
jgi:flagellar hook-basal body complex protein FliE